MKPKVWRKSEFVNGDYDVYPFACDYIEVYRSTTRGIFFDEKWEQLHEHTERGTEHDNVLRLGRLIGFDSKGAGKDHEAYQKERFFRRLPELSDKNELNLTKEQKEEAWEVYKERTESDPVAAKPKGEFTHGVHFWLSTGSVFTTGYGGKVHLKVQVPNDGNLWIKPGDTGGPSRSSAVRKSHNVHNLEEIRQFYSKQELRNRTFQAVYEGDVPIEWIKGVYDSGIHSNQQWHSLSDYVKSLKQSKALKINKAEQIEEFEIIAKEIKERDEIKEQLRFLNKVIELLREMESYIQKISQSFVNLENQVIEFNNRDSGNVFSKPAKHRVMIGQEIDSLNNIKLFLEGSDDYAGYNLARRKLRDIYKEEFNLQDEKFRKVKRPKKFDNFSEGQEEHIREVPVLLRNLNTISDRINSIINETKSFAEEEKEKMDKGAYKEIPMEKEEILESRADQRLREDIAKIPNLEGVSEDIQSRKKIMEKAKEKTLQEERSFQRDYLDGVLIESLEQK